MPRLPLLALAALVLTASGCGSETRLTSERAAAPKTPPPTATSTPTEAATDGSTDGATPSRDRKRRAKPLPEMGQPLHRAGLDGHLLSPAVMPAPDGAVWTRAGDRDDTAAVGACQKSGLEAIGAVRTARSTFTSGPGGAVATQVVGAFADPKSAWRAHEVLRAWQADCEERLDSARTEVGPLRSVVVRAGSGEGYRAAYGPASGERGWSTGLGIVRRGSHLAVVEIRTAPTAYPSERDPARMAVRRIARTFA